jgi:hypothetical protein
MTTVKLLLGIAILLAGVSLFLFGPEHGEQALMVAGLELDSRTATALSIIVTVFGLILALKTFGEWILNNRTKHPA